MVPQTFPSTINAATGTREMVVYALASNIGLKAWTDYIPVKLAPNSFPGKEMSADSDGYIPVSYVSSTTGLVAFADYVPVYVDNAATDAWSVSSAGYLPYGLAGAGGASLDLRFAYNGATLPSTVTFTRADTTAAATRFNSAGLMETFGVNKLLYSSTFDNGAWSKTDVTASPSAASPLDSAYLMTNGATTNSVLTQAITVAAGSTIVYSILVKRGSNDWFAMVLGDPGYTNGANAWFNLNTGVTGSTSARGGGTAISSSITSLGGGWYRCALTCLPSGVYTSLTMWVATVTGNASLTTVSGATYYASAAQLELGSTANAYSPTQGTSTSGPRFDYDPSTPAGVTGGELVAAPASWATNSYVSIVGSTQVWNGTQGAYAASGVSTGNPIIVGKTYKVTYTVSNIGINQGIQPLLGGVAQPNMYVSANGTYTVYYQALATGGIGFQDAGYTANRFSGTISNISVQEVTFTPRGLLIEESRTNLLTYSRDMTNAAWTKTDVTPARTQVGLDGVANTACLMTAGVAGTSKTAQNVTIVANSTVTISSVFKYGNCPWVMITTATSGSNGARAWFNIQTGTKGSTIAVGTGSAISSTMTSLGGGWYRCTLTCLPDAVSTTTTHEMYDVSADGSVTRVNNSTYIVDCAQLEVGAFATSIIPTGAATVTRAGDAPVITGTNYSSWAGSAAVGTAVTEVTGLSNTNTFYSVMDQSGTGYIAFRWTGTSYTGIKRNDTGTPNNDAATGVGTFISGVAKFAQAWDTGNNTVCVNGSTPVTGSVAGAIPVPVELCFGRQQAATATAGSFYLRRFTFYNTKLPDATIKSLST